MSSLPAILHVDVDAFAVSVERVLNPALSHRPVIVGAEAGGRGLVICASYEARRLGVRPGMPVALARRRYPETLLLPGNPAEYERFSWRLFELLRDSAPMAEAASLDDFYLDLTGCRSLFGGDLLHWAAQLARRIRKETGLPVSMGLASNRMVARIATCLAKPRHVLHVPAGAEGEFLSPVGVRLLPGVGRETRRRLDECGVRRIGQMHALGEERLRLLFGTAGSTLWLRARGECHEPVRACALHQTLSCTHQFDQDTANPDQVEGGMVLLAGRLAWNLRRHGVRCVQVTLELTYADGATASRTARLDATTDREEDLIPALREALSGTFRRRVRVRRLRLTAPFLSASELGQSDLFSEERRRRDSALHEAIDKVRARHGFQSLIPAPALLSRGR